MENQMEDYPTQAMKPGTFIRANRLDRLGIVTDAFYGERDADNQPIIVYTILLLPKNNHLSSSREEEGYFLTNEFEYEVTGYLMLKPVNMKELNMKLKGGLFI